MSLRTAVSLRRPAGVSHGCSSAQHHWEWTLLFYAYGFAHLWSILIIVQRDATQSSLFIILQVHCSCFGCQPHLSSGVHKTVTTASGTGPATSIQRGRGQVGHVGGR